MGQPCLVSRKGNNFVSATKLTILNLKIETIYFYKTYSVQGSLDWVKASLPFLYHFKQPQSWYVTCQSIF